jgi:hypothetical protein
MVQMINGKEYYTMEESSVILDKKIKVRAKDFAQKIVAKNKANRLANNEKMYV